MLRVFTEHVLLWIWLTLQYLWWFLELRQETLLGIYPNSFQEGFALKVAAISAFGCVKEEFGYVCCVDVAGMFLLNKSFSLRLYKHAVPHMLRVNIISENGKNRTRSSHCRVDSCVERTGQERLLACLCQVCVWCSYRCGNPCAGQESIIYIWETLMFWC